jgi:hypothetical protein
MWWKYEIFLDENRARRIFTTYVSADSELQANEKIAEELRKYDVLLYRSAPALHLGDSSPPQLDHGAFTESPGVVVVPYPKTQPAQGNSSRKLN